ncbi:winged helix-turn-helix domain-containing protein [Gammaproteobacteria bacterium]|nr:winged helix-turn-helix domain-containing protein [Gammaproteobacteria bacterium]
MQAKVHQKRMPTAHRILEFLSEGPQTSSELHEKMNNELSGTISVSTLGNQLKLLVEKELVSKENRRGGRYPLVKKKRCS